MITQKDSKKWISKLRYKRRHDSNLKITTEHYRHRRNISSLQLTEKKDASSNDQDQQPQYINTENG